MAAILRPYCEIVASPFEVKHAASNLNSLAELIKSVDGEFRIVMEHTRRYYEPIVRRLFEANFFVSAINLKLIIKQDGEHLNTASTTLESLSTLMNETAAKLSEYSVVLVMKDACTSLEPQLIVEIGDVTRFTHKGAIAAFADMNLGVNTSSSYAQKSVPTSKRGSAELRKNLF